MQYQIAIIYQIEMSWSLDRKKQIFWNWLADNLLKGDMIQINGVILYLFDINQLPH